MTFEQVIKAAIPDADKATVEYVLWERTPFPMGRVTAKSLYKAASGFRRAGKNGIILCTTCHRVAVDGWNCESCNEALAAVREQIN